MTRFAAAVASSCWRSPRRRCTSFETSPPWFERIRYPLHYTAMRPRAGAGGGTRPGAARGGDLPGVEVPPGRALRVRRDRADAAHAVDREGDRAPHRRHGVPRQRPHRSGDQHPLRHLVPARPVREVRLRAARPRRLQRGPGQRRPLARARGRASSSRRRGPTSPAWSTCARSTTKPGAPSSTPVSDVRASIQAELATGRLRACVSRPRRTTRSGRWSSWPRPGAGR